MSKLTRVILVLFFALFSFPASSEVKVLAKETVDFGVCVLNIELTAQNLGVKPISIVDTGVLRIVRFPTSDGSVLVSCSKLDRIMLIQHSDECPKC